MNDELGTISLCYSVKYERTSKHSAERLWRAISSPDEVSRWMGYSTAIDLRLGGEYTMDFRSTEGGVMACIIVRIEPEQALAYATGLSVCEWTIEPGGDGCSYTFVQNGLPDRGEGEEELIAGWHGFFDQLDDFLDGLDVDYVRHSAVWKERLAPYRDRFRAVLPFASAGAGG